jgi:hypothetical protein
MGLLTQPDGLYDLLVTLGTDHADTGVFQGDRVDLLLAGVIRGDRPMTIIWRFVHALPADLFRRLSVLRGV